MDFIFDILNTFIQIGLYTGAAFIIINLMRTKKLSSAKNDLQSLEARLSQLRLALKAKIKKKSNIFRAMFKAPIIEGDNFDSTAKALVEIKFDSSDDFQLYFDISRQIVKIIMSENGETPNGKSADNNFMSSDFKTEMDIIRIIKEMIDISARINNRIEEHNRTSSQKLNRVENLAFGSISEINRVFNSEENEETVDTNNTTNKAS